MNILKALLPSQAKFFELFKFQATKAREACEVFITLLEDSNSDKIDRIKEIEHEGDRTVHKIREELDKTFITPLDDTDIIQLSSCLDDILDHLFIAARKLTLYNHKHNEKREVCEEFLKVIHEACTILEEIFEENDLKKVRPRMIRIHELEDEGDEVYFRGLAKLSAVKNCLAIVTLNDIYNELENAIDKAQDVAELFLSILIKER